MSNNTEDKEIFAFHPGEYLKDLMEEYSLTQEEFAERLGITPDTIRKLIHGKSNISGDIALKLSEFTGTSSDLWLNLQMKYDQIKHTYLADRTSE